MEKEKGDNYDNVNMDMSDESDNEMFACKDEYKTFKKQFSKKTKKDEPKNEYGGGEEEVTGPGGRRLEFNTAGPRFGAPAAAVGNEYGGGSSEYGGGGGEYGGGSGNVYSGVRSKWEDEEPAPQSHHGHHDRESRGGRPSFKTELIGRKGRPRPERSPSPEPAPVRIEREAKLYKPDQDRASKEERTTKSRERRSRSRDKRSRSRDKGRRSRSRSKGRRRSKSKERGRDLKRSRSRSKDRSRDLKRDLKDDLRRTRSRSRDRRDRDRRGDDRRDLDRRDDRRDWRGGRGGFRGGRDRRGGAFERQKDEHRKTIEEQMRKVEEMGVEMPKYYRPGAVNPLNYAEQVQKRKMLWKKPGTGEEEPPAAQPVAEKKSIFASEYAPEKKPAAAKPAPGPVSFNKWEATNFGDDESNEKFRRLMGIKAAPKPDEFASEDAPGKNATKIMSDLEKGYEVARQQTHKNRGIGLGFSSMEPHQPYVNPHVQHTQAQAHGYGHQGPQQGYGHPGGQGYGHQGPMGGPPAHAGRGRGNFGINFVKKM